jgi:hypothetical protein
VPESKSSTKVDHFCQILGRSDQSPEGDSKYDLAALDEECLLKSSKADRPTVPYFHDEAGLRQRKTLSQ